MSNQQKYVVMVTSESGTTWPVGTPAQRGFTENGVDTALSQVREALPTGWSCRMEEITPLNYLFESIAHLRKN